MRQALTATLEAGASWKLAAPVATEAEARAAIDAAPPALVIIDVHLAGGCGFNLARHLAEHRPELPVLMLGQHAEGLCAKRPLRAGARGFVDHHDSGAVITEAVRYLLAGSYDVSRSVLDDLLPSLARRSEPVIPSPRDVLSTREMEYVELTGAGLTA